MTGPTPASKHETVIQRYAGPLRSSLLFYRTSPQSRSHKSFLAHQPILPPFLVQAFVAALKSHGLLDGVQIFHLPEGEADAYCVALADELEGFVVGNDSDFAILGAKAGESSTGYRGYIPIEMIQWQLQLAAKTASPVETSQAAEQQGVGVDDGFQPVKSRKSKSTASKGTDRNHSAPPNQAGKKQTRPTQNTQPETPTHRPPQTPTHRPSKRNAEASSPPRNYDSKPPLSKPIDSRRKPHAPRTTPRDPMRQL